MWWGKLWARAQQYRRYNMKLPRWYALWRAYRIERAHRKEKM